MILSIDVGIRNHAMCLLDDKNNNRVENWDVDGIPPEHKNGIYVSMRDHLDARPWSFQLREQFPKENLK